MTKTNSELDVLIKKGWKIVSDKKKELDTHRAKISNNGNRHNIPNYKAIIDTMIKHNERLNDLFSKMIIEVAKRNQESEEITRIALKQIANAIELMAKTDQNTIQGDSKVTFKIRRNNNGLITEIIKETK